jgi:dTDP-4-amino-4,6-dideoxygalactose transaminase
MKLYSKIKISKKDLFLKLQENDLYLQVHYIPVHLQPFYQKFGFKEGDFLNAEEYYKKTISLPIYFGLSDGDLSVVVNIIKRLI